MTDAEREQIVALLDRLIKAGMSPGYLRLASILNRVDKPVVADAKDLDPTELHRDK
jgi:hypothetical protein